MSSPTISVALCTYNGERFLSEQLESIVRQSVRPAEIVVCDDNSSDNTINVINEFAAATNIPFRVHVNKQRKGVTKNFRQAISLCEGDYIALCDQDDVWMNHKLEKLLSVFQQHPSAEIAFSDLLLVNDQLQSLGRTMWQQINFNRRIRNQWKKKGALPVLLYKGNVATGSSMMIRKSFFPLAEESMNKNYRIWIHDGLLALAAAKHNSLFFLEEVTGFYRQHEQQLIGGNTSDLLPSREPGSELDEKIKEYSDNKTDLLEMGFSEHELAELDRKIRHLMTRKKLPRFRLWRIPVILKEFFQLHYYRYSESIFRKAIRDLFTKRLAALI